MSHGFETFNFLITAYDATPTYLSHAQYRMKYQLGKNAFDFLMGTTFLELNVPNGTARDSSQSDEARVKLSRCLQLRPMKPNPAFTISCIYINAFITFSSIIAEYNTDQFRSRVCPLIARLQINISDSIGYCNYMIL